MVEQEALEHPYGMRSLLRRSLWDEDALRDGVLPYVIQLLADTMADETFGPFVVKSTIC
jgi:hypothetical protein